MRNQSREKSNTKCISHTGKGKKKYQKLGSSLGILKPYTEVFHMLAGKNRSLGKRNPDSNPLLQQNGQRSPAQRTNIGNVGLHMLELYVSTQIGLVKIPSRLRQCTDVMFHGFAVRKCFRLTGPQV